jgi:hypothetical protein
MRAGLGAAVAAEEDDRLVATTVPSTEGHGMPGVILADTGSLAPGTGGASPR